MGDVMVLVDSEEEEMEEEEEDHDDHHEGPEGEGTEENIDAHYYGSQEWQETK